MQPVSMSVRNRQTEIDAVDAFLAAPKGLKGGHPQWAKNTRGELEAIWIITEADGRERAQLRFCCSRPYRAYPSVSLIFRSNPVWRCDLVPATEGKLNPPGAFDFDLPSMVYGNHSHTWPDNRSHVLNSAWELPFRRPMPPAIQKISQCYQALATDINLQLSPHQYGFEVPPMAELF
jgi:hypothetical protein